MLEYGSQGEKRWEKAQSNDAVDSWEEVCSWYFTSENYLDYSYVANAGEVAFVNARREVLRLPRAGPDYRENKARY